MLTFSNFPHEYYIIVTRVQISVAKEENYVPIEVENKPPTYNKKMEKHYDRERAICIFLLR